MDPPTPSSPKPTGGNRKPLPLIVDVATDPSGLQLYQVHKTNRRVRRSMPLPQNFQGRPTLTSRYAVDSINAKPVSRAPRSGGRGGETTSGGTGLELEASVSSDEDDARRLSSAASAALQVPEDFAPTEEVWSREVEAAFKEALETIPKQGTRVYQVVGRGKSRGRNELISDFICQKTGKVRTRKQVSSHIQVIKNLKRDAKLIHLIEHGPQVSTLVSPSGNSSFSMPTPSQQGWPSYEKTPVSRLPPLIQVSDFYLQTMLYPGMMHTYSTLSPNVNPALTFHKFGLGFPDLPPIVNESRVPVVLVSVNLNFPPYCGAGAPLINSPLRLLVSDIAQDASAEWKTISSVYTHGVETFRLEETPLIILRGATLIEFLSSLPPQFLSTLSALNPALITAYTIQQVLISLTLLDIPPQKQAVILWEFSPCPASEIARTYVTALVSASTPMRSIIDNDSTAHELSLPHNSFWSQGDESSAGGSGSSTAGSANPWSEQPFQQQGGRPPFLYQRDHQPLNIQGNSDSSQGSGYSYNLDTLEAVELPEDDPREKGDDDDQTIEREWMLPLQYQNLVTFESTTIAPKPYLYDSTYNSAPNIQDSPLFNPFGYDLGAIPTFGVMETALKDGRFGPSLLGLFEDKSPWVAYPVT